LIRALLSGCLLSFLFHTCAFCEELPTALIYDLPASEFSRTLGGDPTSTLTKADRRALESYRFDGDTLKVVALLVDWTDRPATYTTKTMDSLLFSHGVYASGSLGDYFDEVSYGTQTVVGDCYGWINGGDYNDGNIDLYTFVYNLLYEVDAFIDFSQYDGNGDGLVDAVVIVRSGTGQEDSHDPTDIWSFATAYGNPPGPFDGKYVQRWNTSPELQPLRNPDNPTEYSGEDSLNSIRVFCHELSHNMGLPDLYDYDAKLDLSTYITPDDFNDHPMVNYCIMAYGGYGLMHLGKTVPHHSGWCKAKLGYVQPIELVDIDTTIQIADIETHQTNSLFKIPIDPSTGEYFLLEYRNASSSALFDHFDGDYSVWLWPDLAFGADSLQSGLLVTHVYDAAAGGWMDNDGWPQYEHYMVALVDAGYTPSMDFTQNPGGVLSDSAAWWYPYETRVGAPFTSAIPEKAVLGPGTTPSSDGYYGPTGITIEVLGFEGDMLDVHVHAPDPDDIDGDGVPNSEDNCLTESNPDQADLDEDGIGDVCDSLCCALRGNVDHSGTIDIADLVYLVDYMFSGAPPPPCAGEADIDGGGGADPIDIADLVFLVDYMFNAGPPPPACP